MWKIRCHGAAQRRQTWSAGTVSFVRRLLRLLGWRGLVNVFVLVAFFTALVVRRSDLRRAAAELGEVDVRWVVLLIGMTLLRLLTQGFYTAAVTPGIGLRQGIAVHEVTTGANNTIVGSGLISTGLRIAMLRSWGVGEHAVAVTIVILNVVAAYLVWFVAGAAAITALAATTGVVAPGLATAVIAAAVVVLTASTALWWLLLSSPKTVQWAARLAQRPLDALVRRFARLPRLDRHRGHAGRGLLRVRVGPARRRFESASRWHRSDRVRACSPTDAVRRRRQHCRCCRAHLPHAHIRVSNRDRGDRVCAVAPQRARRCEHQPENEQRRRCAASAIGGVVKRRIRLRDAGGSCRP
jgi:hypothetical protein